VIAATRRLLACTFMLNVIGDLTLWIGDYRCEGW
jgi:hypothetical protein